MRAFRSLCITIVLFSLAGCDQLASMAGPSELVSFGYVRPVSCERRGPISYNCVMRNHFDGLREAHMECAGFDAQGRMVGSSKSVHALWVPLCSQARSESQPSSMRRGLQRWSVLM